MPLPVTPVPIVPWRRRLPALASVVYVVALAVRADAGQRARGWIMGVVAIGVAMAAARRRSRISRTAGWGLAVAVAAVGAESTSHSLAACGALGLVACTAAACTALTRLPLEGGMVPVKPTSPALAIAVVAIAWWVAIASQVAPERGPIRWVPDDAGAWTAAALFVNVVSLVAAAEFVVARRRLELAVAERASAMRSLFGILLVAGALVIVVGRARADAVVRLGIALGAVLVVGAALHPDAVRAAAIARRALVVSVLGGGVALVGASAADGPGDAWDVTLLTAAVTLAIGASAGVFEAPLRPAGGAWLEAFVRACDEAVRAEPDDALRETLVALRAPVGLAFRSPELCTFSPNAVVAVDAAGYLHQREADVPEALPFAAAGEPQATLRADVLDALQVRRPEIRPLAEWMNERGAMLATLVACAGEVEGVLVMPRGRRREAATLEEVRALKRVADRLAAVCRARATRARALEREREALASAGAALDLVERLRHERSVAVGRDALAAARLARPATVGVYAASSRMALEALERRTALGAPIAVVAPSGVDPVPFLARAHLTGIRGDGPFVLVDGTCAREHDVARWSDPSCSPLALVHRGMLVLLDGAGLPIEVQRLIARACAERRTPWDRPEPLSLQIALTGVAEPNELLAQGRLDPALAVRLSDARLAPVPLPRLRDRPEDLRAIVTDRVAREGLRVIGRPVGIEQAAYARLAQYTFPGEDAELASIVRRLVASACRGDREQREHDVIRVADVDALQLTFEPAEERKDPLSA